MLKVLHMEEAPDYSLSGKTGLGMTPKGNISWFVGYVNRGGQLYYFATRVQSASADAQGRDLRSIRINATYAALKTLGIIQQP